MSLLVISSGAGVHNDVKSIRSSSVKQPRSLRFQNLSTIGRPAATRIGGLSSVAFKCPRITQDVRITSD